MIDLKRLLGLDAADDVIRKVIEQQEKEEEQKITKFVKSIMGFSPEEKRIMDQIQETLIEHNQIFLYDENKPGKVTFDIETEYKHVTVCIFVQLSKVLFSLCFPFQVQPEAMAFVTLFMTDFNYHKAFAHMNLNTYDGELTMDYSYFLKDPERFDKNDFWVYLMSVIQPSLAEYLHLERMARGELRTEEKRNYKKYLKQALETFHEDSDDCIKNREGGGQDAAI